MALNGTLAIVGTSYWCLKQQQLSMSVREVGTMSWRGAAQRCSQRNADGWGEPAAEMSLRLVYRADWLSEWTVAAPSISSPYQANDWLAGWILHRIDVQLPPAAEDSPQKHQEHNVKFVIGGQEKHTKFNKSQTDADIEQTLNFDLKDLSGEEDVLMEIHTHNKKKTALVANKLPLSNFIGELKNVVITFTSPGPKPTTVKVFVSSKWASKTSTQKYAGEGSATIVDAAKAAVTGHPQTSLALTQEPHRPWFTRVSYYYDTTKHVYSYTTSFRVVSKLARFGESSANLVLQKVSGKSLHDLDQQFLVPVLDTLDNKVDATISTVVTKLFEGQQYVLKKKDDVVDTASSVASKGSSSVSSVVGKTVGGVVKVKDYTTTQLVNVSSAAYGTVVGVKDYTTTQVVNVSSSTYGTVKGATVYVLSHVPYLGAKIRA